MSEEGEEEEERRLIDLLASLQVKTVDNGYARKVQDEFALI